MPSSTEARADAIERRARAVPYHRTVEEVGTHILSEAVHGGRPLDLQMLFGDAVLEVAERLIQDAPTQTAAPASSPVGINRRSTPQELETERMPMGTPSHTPTLNARVPDRGGAGTAGAGPYDSLRALPRAGMPVRTAYDAIARMYAALLPFRPRVAGDRLVLEAHAGRRKESGAFYTPRHVARLVVERALEPLDSLDSPHPGYPLLRILDPAMGVGVFLLEAVHFLVEQTGCSPARIAERCIHGFDIDPIAVRLAILALAHETGARPEVLATRLRCADALVALPWPGIRFDAVVGNPPWGARYPAGHHAELRERLGIPAAGTPDSFKLFLAAGAVASRGTVGMLLPRAMLAQEKHADMREFMLERFAPYAIVDLGDRIFAGAAAPACAVVFGPKPGPDRIRYERALPHGNSQPASSPSVVYSRTSGFLSGPPRLLRLLHRLQQNGPVLGDLRHLYRVRDAGINYNCASAGRHALYTGPLAEHPLDRPCYRGRDFARYTRIERSGWLRHNAAVRLAGGERVSFTAAVFDLPEKIVFRQTADRIVATLDTTRMAMGRSVIAITGEGGSLPALLGCLNSALLTVLYRLLAGEEGRILPQVKVRRMLALPLPLHASPEGDAGGWGHLDSLARALLRSGGDDAEPDRAIDRVVYELYGLTDGEIAAVEAACSVTAGAALCSASPRRS